MPENDLVNTVWRQIQSDAHFGGQTSCARFALVNDSFQWKQIVDIYFVVCRFFKTFSLFLPQYSQRTVDEWDSLPVDCEQVKDMPDIPQVEEMWLDL